MTPTNLHYVPWNGNIEANISEARANQLLIAETAEVSKNLTAQMERLNDAGVSFDYMLPTANGFIMKGVDASKAYDAVYGGSTKSENKATVVPFQPAFENSIKLYAVFDGVALNDNGVSRAPKLDRAFGTAVQAPVVSAPSLERQLAA